MIIAKNRIKIMEVGRNYETMYHLSKTEKWISYTWEKYLSRL